MAAMDKAAVIFGKGPVGTGVAEILLERGYSVTTFSRSGGFGPAFINPEVSGNQQGTRWKSGTIDLHNSSQVIEATAGAQFIFHCANVPYPRWAQDLPSFLDSIIAAGAAHGSTVVYTDNLYAYDTTATQPLDENSPRTGPSKKGRLRLELADRLLTQAEERGFSAAILQGGDFFGPGVTENGHFGSRFFEPLSQGKKPYLLGRQDKLHSYSYVPDFVRAMVDVAEDGKAHGKTWIAPLQKPLTQAELGGLLSQEAGYEFIYQGVGKGMVRFMGLFNPLMAQLPELYYQMDRPFVFSSAAFEAHFGWGATEIKQAAQRTARWYTQKQKAGV